MLVVGGRVLVLLTRAWGLLEAVPVGYCWGGGYGGARWRMARLSLPLKRLYPGGEDWRGYRFISRVEIEGCRGSIDKVTICGLKGERTDLEFGTKVAACDGTIGVYFGGPNKDPSNG